MSARRGAGPSAGGRSGGGGSSRSQRRARPQGQKRSAEAYRRPVSSPGLLEPAGPPPKPEEPWVPPPNSARRYDRIEMALAKMELEMNLAQVLADAWQRWDRKPAPGVIPPPAPPKDPLRAQLEALAEHQRRLGQARELLRRQSSLVAASMAATAEKKKLELAKEKSAMLLMDMERMDEEKPRAVPTDAGDPCQQLQEPCRRLFKGTCHPCPVHTPGVPRDPKKKCTCTLTPRPETHKDALNFLIGLPRELNATYSSLDPARIEEEQQRKKSEAKWRRRLEEQQARFDKAMRRARSLLEAQVHVSKPPFVAEHNELTCAKGLSTVRVNLVF